MKKISLHCITDKQENAVRTNLNRYRIFLAWGVTNLFKNKKKAAIFQAGLNVWVNDTFYEINSLYATLLFQYRRSWVFTSLALDDKVKKHFENIERYIFKLFRSDYKGSESIFYAFEAIEVLCNELSACNEELIHYYHEKHQWERIKELTLISNQLKRIIKELTETSDPGTLGQKLRR